jgi:dTDP-4-dehydrorhamnose reductase
MRIFLTGSTGQLGKSILEQFTDCEFHAPDRNSLELTSHEGVKQAVYTFKPDVIINAAAWTDVPAAEQFAEEAMRVNLNAVENLARAGADVGARFIQVSTDFVFDGVTTIPYNETSQKNPLSVYGKSKSDAEDFLLSEFSENSYIIRTSWLYSRHRRNFVKTILKRLISESVNLEVVSDQKGSPTLSHDLSDALELFCRKDFEPGTYHFANTGTASWHSFAQAIAEYSGLDSGRVIPIATKNLEAKVKRPMFSVLNTTKYTLTTGSAPRQWQESLLGELPKIRAEVEKDL